MARIRSIDFLPEIFQTETNRKFLNSTLDQLIQEPKLKQTQGYIGRRNAPGKSSEDGYVLEPTTRRAQYQLEPGVIFKDDNGNTVDALTYMGLIDGLATAGANVENHDRMFTSETYSWSPFVDFDKIVNYSQYYWLSNGPAPVNVQAASVFLTDDFAFTANDSTYSVENFPDQNPAITLLRGGTYNFEVSDPGAPFYIQTQPGVDGVVSWADNISSREVLGVTNNGEDDGTITFAVPETTAQDFYHTLPLIGDVDLATDERMDAIAGQELDVVIPLLGLQDIDAKTIVFLREDNLGWDNDGTPVTTLADKYQVYRIQLVGTIVSLIPTTLIAINDRFTILYGDLYSNVDFYKNSGGFFEKVPLETASLETLYYQDSTNPDRFGILNIVNQEQAAVLDVTDIIGAETYTSPNGVIFTNGLKVKFRNEVIPVEYTDLEYYVEGVGTAIRLVLTTDLHVPEDFAVGFPAPWDITGWDLEGMDNTLNAPVDQDYIVINRSSQDLNAWSRSNRWFHIDVITATAEYNGADLDLDNANRASRPIIEFEPDLRLFNYGTHGKKLIDVIDFVTTDAMSTVNGAEEHLVDDFALYNGARVIFANDTDPDVQDKIYTVEFIDPDLDGTDTINLTLADDADNEIDDVVLLNSGFTQQGKVFTYDGTDWIESQAKVTVNQPPLFNMYDVDGNSLSDFTAYPSTTFAGTKLFSYAEGTGSNDSVLGFPLRYLNIDNLGDIVFDNNLYTDTFLYVEGNVSNPDTPIHTSTPRKYSSRTEFERAFGWTKSIEDSRQAQIFNVIYDNEPITLDILPATDLLIPAVGISANGTFVTRESYTVVDNVITFSIDVADNTELEIKVISDEISAAGYYEVPSNLASNIFNENTSLLTLGTIRNHYNDLAHNILDFEGEFNGANNVRDLGDVSVYGTLIIQQSSPVALAAMFMRNKEYNFYSATEFASSQYEKFKNQLLDWVEKHDVYELTVPEIVDAAIKEINIGKTTTSAFYWSDMLPSGEDYETTSYTITAISTDTYTTLNTYDFLNANTQAMLVYYNGAILLKDLDYTVSTDGPRITLLIDTVVGATLTINEYDTTLGASVPSTPTKLGLYPKFRPEIYEDDTYVTPTDVIRGHDGSITTSFGKSSTGENDIRDLVLLEFEKRIYNNIKVNDQLPIKPSDVIPGEFRVTDYTEEEVTLILSQNILSWLGRNRIDYKSQDYSQNEKTWNYGSATSKTTGELFAQSNWRGIYFSFYDTDAPHTRPWEMVGLFEKPSWWEAYYGPAPYTSGNLVLWDDMEAGMIREPGNERVVERFKRPGLTDILPVDGEGNLVMPLASVVSSYSQYDFKKSWTIGDMAPAETAWRKSSAWPFAIQRLYALTKPAEYFALMVDRDRYVYNPVVEQYLYDDSTRLDARTIEIQDANLIKHSYVNWILDYNRHFGYESSTQLKSVLSNLDVNLCHHMASFTDKNNLKIFTDKSSPDSTNSSLLLPDESFNLLLYKNQPTDEIIYSSIIIQNVAGGYSITGNSFTDPYFKIQKSVDTGKFTTLTVGRSANTSTSVSIPLSFRDEVEFIPYGNIFTSKQAVAEFIVSYSEYLTRAGLKFDTYENDNPVDWTQMVQEFIYWSDQGWALNSIVNLNPAASQIEFERELNIVDDLNNLELTEQPLNQNRQPLDISDYVVDRIDNNFKIKMINKNIISYLKFNLTSFEHLLVLDNVSIFNDLIYDPVTGVRQQRVKLSGFTTFEWNGQLDAQGFLFNEDNVKEWAEVNTYNKGDIITFKNVYWSAAEKIQPSETFDFSQWVKTDYDKINKGLLPNLATKSDQMLQYYNNKTANLESDIDLLAFGLTGFRSRDYLRGLDLDDISQVNIYGDMIENKGTANSLNLFKDVTLNNETVDYEIFENWALRRARYGATSNRNYIELNLDEDQLPASPSLIEVVGSLTDPSVSDQLVSLNNIYKQSIKNTSPDIFPLRTSRNLDTALPSAGFVNPDDVDLAVFDISDISSDITEGTLIWVAKDTETEWNVYRTVKIDPVVIKVNDNLNGTLTLETDLAHNLIEGTTIDIDGADLRVDGTHLILGTSDSVNILIAGELAENQTCILDITGTILEFVTARVDVPSDIAGTDFDNEINMTQTVWVSNDDGKSATYKKLDPFALSDTFTSPEATNFDYGFSVSQGYNDAGMLVGDPGSNETQLYGKNGSGNYTFGGTLSIGNDGIARYGHATTMIETWGAVSAPGTTILPGAVAILNRNATSGITDEVQLIVSPTITADDGFGSSIAMSQDENWLFVGEPNNNKVHAYQRVDYAIQEFSALGDGTSNTYDISNDINAANALELNVVVDNILLDAGVDYEFDGTEVDFTIGTTPTVGQVVDITRKEITTWTAAGVGPYNIDLYAVATLDESNVVVAVDGVLQIPVTDYTATATTITFEVGSTPTAGATIVISIAPFRYATTIDGTTVGETFTTDRFGEAIDVSANASHIAITAPGVSVVTADQNNVTADQDSITADNGCDVDCGAAYMIDRVVERFVITDDNVAYTTDRTPSGAVFNNGVQLVNADLNVNYDYTISVNTITLEADVISIGDFLDIGALEFKLIQKVELATPAAGANFGNAVTICKSKCSLYIGAENDLNGQGSVTRFINGSRMFGALTSTEQNPTIGANSTLRINNVEVDISGTSDAVANLIKAAAIPNVTASADTDGYLTIELVNKELTSLANKLDVLPGDNTTLVELGLESYYVGQTITSPTEATQAQHFGSSVNIDLNLNQLVVSAEDGNVVYDNTATADNDINTADSSAPTSSAMIVESSGVVYTYDLLPDGDEFSGGKLVFGQQIFDTAMSAGDKFGNAISLVDGLLVVGSTDYNTDEGRIIIFANATNSLSWRATTTQNDIVDVELINSVYIYNNETLAVNRYLDYIDPLNGKILGVAKQNIDLIMPSDPTIYDNANNGVLWGCQQVDMIWWDISNVRFLDYNLGDARVSSGLWGKVFPGSSVDIYQWVESKALPVDYAGTGTVFDVNKYVTIAEIDRSGTIQNTYYFWVNKVETTSVNSEKTLSAAAIASYIEAPAASGVSYAAFIAQGIVGMYNCKDIISDLTSVLYVEYDQTKNSNNVFVEYDLFRENHPTDFLSDSLYKKLQDSLCGVDHLGNLVPDPNLIGDDKYGIEFRPRKSMFIDRYAALTSYMTKVNGILAEHTIAESRAYPLLDSEEPEPSATSGEWDQKVSNNEELSFQDLTTVATGYKYLVETDETRNGLWAIYEVSAVPDLVLVNTQSFDTKRFWDLAHWYEANFDPFTKIDYVVNEVSGLSTIDNVENNAVAKVLHNSVGSWEIHQLTDGIWNRVGLEDGTIQLNATLWDYEAGRYGYDVEVFSTQNFDEEPVTELRQIIRSINEELLVGDLSVERSDLILSVFNYVLAEQPNVDWLYKTSMIDVTQNVRSLSQYAVYQKDNQDYLIDYIKEAKPYHTKIKDFLFSYDGLDVMEGQVTDFDCPSTYSEAFGQYISPILDDGAILVTDPSNAKADDEVWQTDPWKQWYDNYRLEVIGVDINSPGSDYTIAPRVIVTGDSLVPAEMTAVLGDLGTIGQVIIDNPGSGYLETPVITFDGGNGTGATATAIMENNLVRTFNTTMKYDRYEYETKVAMWADNNVITTRNLVFKYDDTLEDAVLPTLYRVIELYVDTDDNTVFHAAKFEAVPFYLDADGNRIYNSMTADRTTITGDNDELTVDAANGLDSIERKYFKEGIARWYQLDGVWINENDNSESRNFVRYNDEVYKMITFEDTAEFLASKYELVEIETLGGIDRTTGSYVSDVNNPGLDLSLLINGIAYPGVQVDGDGFGVTEEELDAIYASDFLDTYLGTRPTDVNVDGGEFIDTYHSHAPEELVPCSIFDTLNITVSARPGSDYETDGHSFAIGSKVYTATGAASEPFSFDGLSTHPIKVLVANVTTGKMLYESTDFTVNWQTMNVVTASGITIGDEIKVFVYEIGGGNQLHRNTLLGIDVTLETNVVGDTFTVPVKNDEIYEVIVFKNGIETAVTTASIDNQTASVILPSAPVDTDFITVTVMGFATPQREESYPVTQFLTNTTTIDATELYGKWQEDAIVSVEGLRLRGPEGARYIADGASDIFMMPDTGGFIFSTISDIEVSVYVNNEPLVLNDDFAVSPPNADVQRWVDLVNTPLDGDVVNVYVRTASEYWWTATDIVFVTPPGASDLIAITTFKDYFEMDTLTQVFVGPTLITEQNNDSFGNTGFDSAAFDFEIGVNSEANLFELPGIITTPGRLWVTVNGERLHNGTGYSVVNDTQLLLTIPIIGATDVVVVLSITDNVITEGSEFRLFKDMRDNVGMYKLADSTTYLTQELLDDEDTIHVADASVLGVPNLDIALFGILIINGERITYRERDLGANTVSGLRRGTAGTGAGATGTQDVITHPVDTPVYDVSSKSLVQWDYDKIWYAQGTSTASDGISLQEQETTPAVFIKK